MNPFFRPDFQSKQQLGNATMLSCKIHGMIFQTRATTNHFFIEVDSNVDLVLNDLKEKKSMNFVQNIDFFDTCG